MAKVWQQGDNQLICNEKTLDAFKALLGDNKQPVLFNGEKGTASRGEYNYVCIELEELEITIEVDNTNVCKVNCSEFEVVNVEDNGEINTDTIEFVAHKTPLTGSALNQFVEEINRNIESSKVVLKVLTVDDNAANMVLSYEHDLIIANPKPTPMLERLIEKAFHDNFVGHELIFSFCGDMLIQKI